MANIQSVLTENRIFQPPESLVKQANISGMAAYRALRRRIEAFIALPLQDLRQDRARLKLELDRIGEQVR